MAASQILISMVCFGPDGTERVVGLGPKLITVIRMRGTRKGHDCIYEEPP